MYAPGQHLSVSQYPGLYARAFVVSSFGKTFHVTGWKLGACVAPAALTQEFRKVHQFNVFTVNTPMQHGVANYMANPQTYTSLPETIEREFGVLKSIRDNYPKYVLSLDTLFGENFDGIQRINLIDFLLSEI